MIAFFKNISVDIDRNQFLNNNSNEVSNKLINLFERLDSPVLRKCKIIK